MLSQPPSTPAGPLQLSHHQAGRGHLHSAAPGEVLRARGAGQSCSAPSSRAWPHFLHPQLSLTALCSLPQRRGSAAVCDGRSLSRASFLSSPSLLHTAGGVLSLCLPGESGPGRCQEPPLNRLIAGVPQPGEGGHHRWGWGGDSCPPLPSLLARGGCLSLTAAPGDIKQGARASSSSHP